MVDRRPVLVDALADLRALEADSDSAIEVVQVRESKDEALLIDLSIDCRGFTHAGKGLRLRSRERFWLYFDIDFPLGPPSIFARDRRFAFNDHVYWVDTLGVSLCVYYSIEHQWRPEHGVVGFIHAFMQWLENAAAGTLDAEAEPIHPPQVTGDSAQEFFVVRADTPIFDGMWLGYAVVEPKAADRLDIVHWSQDSQLHTDKTLAPAILIDTPFVSEFPTHVGALLLFFERLGVDSESLAECLLVHARHTTGRPPMFLVFGVAMRGTVSKCTQQHLVVWRIDDRGANDLRKIARRRKRYTDTSAKKTVAKGTAVIVQWKQSTGRLRYCKVYEDRPQVIVRRDGESGVAWFRGKTVTLWGLGALGSPIAEHLVRAGAAELRILDYGRVTPGLLVRQNYQDNDIGKAKVEALRRRLLTINPDVNIVSSPKNLLYGGDWFDGTLRDSHILIDATASRRVALLLDRFLSNYGPLSLPIVTVGNDANAERALVTATPSEGYLGPTDLLHRAFLHLVAAEETDWLEAFWPVADESQWFEPEPGCSAPTFRGGNADAASLAGGMLTVVGRELFAPTSSMVILGTNMAAKKAAQLRLAFADGDRQLCPDTGYEVRFLAQASADMAAIIDADQRGKQASMETGGVLYGFRDEFLRIAWVVEASPPPDSQRSEHSFLCGVVGVAEADAGWRQRSFGRVGFFGTWHSHPVSAATPSVVDIHAMENLLRQAGPTRHRLLLVIVGYSATTPSIGSYVFGGQRLHDVTTVATSLSVRNEQ